MEILILLVEAVAMKRWSVVSKKHKEKVYNKLLMLSSTKTV